MFRTLGFTAGLIRLTPGLSQGTFAQAPSSLTCRHRAHSLWGLSEVGFSDSLLFLPAGYHPGVIFFLLPHYSVDYYSGVLGCVR